MGEHERGKTADRTLHVCPTCESKLVQPLAWEQVGDRNQWRLWRRCPECEWRDEAVYDVAAIDAYDEQLDLGSRALAGELRALEHDNMSAMAESFIRAIDGDLITADDFRV